MSRFLWRIHGDRTLAYRLDNREVPELFGEEFELGGDEAVAILHGERGLESLTRATLKTGGGLDWIRKFFCRGEPLSVLFHPAGAVEFVLHFHAPCSDGEPLEGAARVSAAVSSMRAALLIPHFGTHTALAVDDLLDPLEKILSEALVPKAKWEKFETFRTAPPALQKVEEALTPVLRDAVKGMGLAPGKITWAWATDEEKGARIHDHLERRAQIAETLEEEREAFGRQRPLRLLGTHLALLKTAQEMLLAAEPPRDLDLHLRASLGVVRPAEGEESHSRETLDGILEEEIERVSEDLKQKKILLGVDRGEYLSAEEAREPLGTVTEPPPPAGSESAPPAPPSGGGEESAEPSSASGPEAEAEPESESVSEEIPVFDLPPLTEALQDVGAASAAVPAGEAEAGPAPEPGEAVSEEAAAEGAAPEEAASEHPLPEEASPAEAVSAEAVPEEPLTGTVPEAAAETAEAEAPPEEGVPRSAEAPKAFVFSPGEETAGAFEPSAPQAGQAAEEFTDEGALSPQELLARFLERTAGMRFADSPPEPPAPEEPPAAEIPATEAPVPEDPVLEAQGSEAPARGMESAVPPPMEPDESAASAEPPPESEISAGGTETFGVEVVEAEPESLSAEAPAPPTAEAVSATEEAAAGPPEEASAWEDIPVAVPAGAGEGTRAPGEVREAEPVQAVEESREVERVEGIEEIEELEPLEILEPFEEPEEIGEGTALPAAAAVSAAVMAAPPPRPQPSEPPAAPTKPGPKPEVRARPVRVAYEWRLYGEDSLAYRIQDCEMPQLLREDFDVGPAQAALVLRGTQCMEVMTTGAVRSGTGLQWIRRLFGPGADVCVLFVVTTPIPLVLDLFSRFADGEPVAAEVILKLRITPASAAGLLSLLDAEGALSGCELREIFTHSVVLPVVERELSSAVSGAKGGLAFSFFPIEAAAREAVKKVAFSWGFLVEELSFRWGADPETFREIDDASWKRTTAEWEMKTRGRLAAAEHASSLITRRMEGLRSLAAALEANAGPDMVRFFTRAALGMETLQGTVPPTAAAVRGALREGRAEAEESLRALGLVREETARTLAAGPPPRPERRAGEEGAGADDFGFLSDGEDDAFDDFAFSFHQPIQAAATQHAPAAPSATHAPAVERRSYAPSALSGMGGGPHGAPPTLGDLSAPIGAAGGSLNRCPYCLSSVKPGWAACGNCGRLLPTS